MCTDSPVPDFPSQAYSPTPVVLNDEQASFYSEKYLPAIWSGKSIELNGQEGYGDHLIRELISLRLTDWNGAVIALEEVILNSSDRSLRDKARRALGDFYFEQGDFEAGYRVTDCSVNLPMYLSTASQANHPRLPAPRVVIWAESFGTDKGMRAFGYSIIDSLQLVLDDYHDTHGVSVLESVWRCLTSERSSAEVAVVLRDYLDVSWTTAELQSLIDEGRLEVAEGQRYAPFYAYPDLKSEIRVDVECAPSIRLLAVVFRFLRFLVRHAENLVREERGIPRIGESWVSETELFRSLVDAFPGERIIHQSRPSWLAPQSLDIHFIDRGLAIEYQGIQHSRPVGFFGGEEGFAEQQQLDALKRLACSTNNTCLLEVHPGYDIAHICMQIREILASSE